MDYEIGTLIQSMEGKTAIKAELKREDKQGSFVTKLWLVHLEDGSTRNVLQQESMNGRQSAIVTDEYLKSIYPQDHV